MSHKPTSECAVAGCNANRYCRGWCTKHYQRWRKHGSPTATLVPANDLSLAERLRANTDQSAGPTGCWPYRGTLNRDGYGLLQSGGKGIRAHRLAYELAHGPISDAMVPDHTCHTEAARNRQCDGGQSCPHRACVNPAHIELVDVRTNNLRGLGLAAANARKTECANGHPFTDENTYHEPGGGRSCRICVRARGRKYDRTRRPRKATRA